VVPRLLGRRVVQGTRLQSFLGRLLEEGWSQKGRLVVVVVVVVRQQHRVQEVEKQIQGLQKEALKEQVPQEVVLQKVEE